MPKTCINYFQKGNYGFNIGELQECYVCVTHIDLNAAIKVAVFENSSPSASADFNESAALART